VGGGDAGVTAMLAVTSVPCTAVMVERLAVTVLATRLVEMVKATGEEMEAL
jgi:hypothetical protein